MHSSPSVIRGSGQLANLRPVSLHEAQPSRASRAQIACATSGQGRCQEHSADPAWLGPAARPPANRWMRALVDVGGHERPRPSRLAAAYTSQPSPPHTDPPGGRSQGTHVHGILGWVGQDKVGHRARGGAHRHLRHTHTGLHVSRPASQLGHSPPGACGSARAHSCVSECLSQAATCSWKACGSLQGGNAPPPLSGDGQLPHLAAWRAQRVVCLTALHLRIGHRAGPGSGG